MPSQKEVSTIWENVWSREKTTTPSDFFRVRLFIEGYPVFKKYVPRDTRSILEIGTGPGRFGLALARDFPNAHVTVTDIVEASLISAARMKEYLGIENVTVERADVFALQYNTGTFDVVFCDAVIQHLPQHNNAVKEMIRVLKPGGTLIISSVNGWNLPHQLYKGVLTLLRKPYFYGYEKNFTPVELVKLLKNFHMTITAQDGFYFAYGVYRWKRRFPIFRWVGGALNRVTKFLDFFTFRAVSRYLGFEIFVVAQKQLIKVKHLEVVPLHAFQDERGGILTTAEFGKTIPFIPKRVYLISGIDDYNAVRGGHAHKKLEQIIFCVNGSFELRVDDGERHQKILMRNNGFGFRIGPRLWHSMRKFSRDCVILVLADEYYDESDYLRNYEEWKKYLTEHPES